MEKTKQGEVYHLIRANKNSDSALTHDDFSSLQAAEDELLFDGELAEDTDFVIIRGGERLHLRVGLTPVEGDAKPAKAQAGTPIEPVAPTKPKRHRRTKA